MKKFIFIFISSFIFLSYSTVSAENISSSFGNFSGAGDLSIFLENILARIQSVFAFLAVLFIVIGGLLYVLAGIFGNEKFVETAKACWTASLIGLSLGIAGPAFIQQLKAIFLRDGKMSATLEDALSFQEIVTNILNFLLSIFGTLAIISLTVSAIFYIFSFGDQKKVLEAIKNSLLGVVIAGSSLLIVNQIITLITK